MNENQLISIIMPVFKVEKYLETAIESVLAQTHKNFELILVDDCSPDQSGEICDKYAKQDNRVKVIHKKKNTGPGESRNFGIEHAIGKWIMFADSDDWVVPTMMEDALYAADEYTDIVIFGLTLCFENIKGRVKYKSYRIPEYFMADTKKQIGDAIAFLDNCGVFPYMVNKMYRSDFYKDIFPNANSLRIMEDFFCNIQLFSNAKKILSLNKSLYNYRKPKHETLASAYNPVFFELSKKRLFAEQEILRTLGANSADNIQVLNAIYIKHLISCFSRLYYKNAPLNSQERRSKAKEYINDEITQNVLATYVPASFKMKLLISMLKTKKAVAGIAIGKINTFVQTYLKFMYTFLRK